MLKYTSLALALKLFSLSKPTYRFLGNTFGSRRRVKAGINSGHLHRARVIYDLIQRYPVEPGARLVELGTGWLHWESILFRLYTDAEITLYDVWDNRQFPAFRVYCEQLKAALNDMDYLQPEHRARAHEVLAGILSKSNFDEVYSLLNWRYVVEPSGTLDVFPENHFDMLYSVNVGEHIHSSIAASNVKKMFRILRPGGLSFHTIDPKDHLSYFTKNVSRKNYLRYSDRVWKLIFENEVQYFNRIQPADWMSYYEDAGFELVEDFSTVTDIRPVKVHPQYGDLSDRDFRRSQINIVHRKPGS